MSNQQAVTVAPTLWASVQLDLQDAGNDIERLAAASVTCTSRITSLSLRTTVVTIETLNVGLGHALDVMPRSYEETEQDILAMFAPAKDDTVDSEAAVK